MEPSRHRPLKVGHKGAGRLAPPNSIGALRAAARLGLDLVEVDVVRHPVDRVLVLAYSPLQARLTTRARLDGALEVVRDLQLRVDLDLKQAGIEAEVARTVAAAGMTGRVLVTARRPDALRAVRAADPALALGWSLGRARHARMVGQRTVPAALGAARAAGLCEAFMLHHPLVTAEALAAAGDAEVFAWTVNDASRVAHLSALGVTGIVSDHPRLFDAGGA
jgi:glycerophosphoryl diester phosphodiesterase